MLVRLSSGNNRARRAACLLAVLKVSTRKSYSNPHDVLALMTLLQRLAENDIINLTKEEVHFAGKGRQQIICM